jgi:hypothetical protein
MQPNHIALQLSITVRGITQRGRSTPQLPNSTLKMLPSTAIRLIPRVSSRSKTPQIDKKKGTGRGRFPAKFWPLANLRARTEPFLVGLVKGQLVELLRLWRPGHLIRWRLELIIGV